MPIDTVGEVVVAAVEVVGEVVFTEPPKHGRWRRFVYWSLAVLLFALLAFGAYLVLS